MSDDDNQSIFDEIKCLNIQSNSRYNRRNASATNSEGKEKTIDQIQGQIDFLKVKFKEYLSIKGFILC